MIVKDYQEVDSYQTYAPEFANCFVKTWAHDAAPEVFPRARAFPEALQ